MKQLLCKRVCITIVTGVSTLRQWNIAGWEIPEPNAQFMMDSPANHVGLPEGIQPNRDDYLYSGCSWILDGYDVGKFTYVVFFSEKWLVFNIALLKWIRGFARWNFSGFMAFTGQYRSISDKYLSYSVVFSQSYYICII